MIEGFPYRNLHHYMDEMFRGKEPSNLEIVEAKAVYTRRYNTALKKQVRALKAHISLSLEHYQLESLKQKAASVDLSLYDYIRKVALNCDPSFLNNKKLQAIKILFAELLDEIEDETELQVVYDRCIQIQKELSQLP